MVVVILALVLMALACGCTDGGTGPEVTATFDEKYRANEKTVVSVENPTGSVTITRGDVRDVVLHVVKRSRAGAEELEKVEISATKGDLLKIRAKWTSVLPPRVTVDMAITVPPYVTVDAVTVSNGDVRIEETKGDVSVSCFNGDVFIRDVDGSVVAAVENGDLEVRETTGIGDLSVKNGAIEAEVRDIDRDVVIEGEGGDIVLAMGPSLDAILSVATKNGVVSVEGLDLEVGPTGTDATGVLGAGIYRLTVECTNGDVNLTAL
ncbi:hypothetical protein AZH53_09970 [Methanomicrobiaceae archaeon CYW5]|uniref:DUF4097 family beta strand repeat-containing protein n=1 Tax=Methanovulcanius yangii TaxID=1789227 RepID=UPI0029CA3DE7|nr:DUF4097 family beta strand repeat-containing protein [Methanovulcanius yangii]MBT8508731.1 hypothetical protein [Methanovulcanius yangii]